MEDVTSINVFADEIKNKANLNKCPLVSTMAQSCLNFEMSIPTKYNWFPPLSVFSTAVSTEGLSMYSRK